MSAPRSRRALLAALAAADGTEHWRHPGDGVGRHVVLVDDLLYTTKDGVLRAFRAT